MTVTVKPRLRLANPPIEFIIHADGEDALNLSFEPYIREGTKWTVGLNWSCDGGGVQTEGHNPDLALWLWQKDFAAHFASQFVDAADWPVAEQLTVQREAA